MAGALVEGSNKQEDDDEGNLLYLHRLPGTPGSIKPGDHSNIVSFDRRELNLILRVYGFRVASGEWRDYAIDMLKGRAVFSIFKRTSEVPLYMIEKNPGLARRQGAYSVVNASGQILKRGHELAQVLKMFDKKPKLVAV